MTHDINAPGTPSAVPLPDRPADRAGSAPYDQVTASIEVPGGAGSGLTASVEVSPLNHIAPEPNTLVTEAMCTLAVKRIAAKLYLGYMQNDVVRADPVAAWEGLTTEQRANWCAAAMAVFPKLNNA